MIKKSKRQRKNNSLTYTTMEKEGLLELEEKLNAVNNDRVKIVKKDRGLIERTESSKIILVEDNRQVLMD